jgi:YD repeat-containing protein
MTVLTSGITLLKNYFMNSKLLSLTAIVSLFIFSCKKNPPNNEGALIKRIVQILPDRNKPIEAFFYDSQKRLTSLRFLDSSSLYDNDLEYDAQSRLSKISYSYIGTEIYSCSFVYNDKGQIIKKITINDPGYDACNDESYTYDDNGRVISDTTYDKQTSTVHYYFTYKYDNNGNIIEDNFVDFNNHSADGKTGYSAPN